MTWQDAHIGSDTSAVSFRATDEERERLEQLRQELRLTSKGQVLRVALDLLEAMQVGQDTLLGHDKQETRRIMRRIRRHVGVPRRKDLEAAAADDAVAKNKNIRTKYTHVIGGSEPGANVSLPDIAPTPPDSGAKEGQEEDEEAWLRLWEHQNSQTSAQEKPNAG